MDALRQSILRAQLAKPLPGGAQAGGAQKSPGARATDVAAIDARFAVLDKKLDTLIHMLKVPGKSQRPSCDLLPTDVRRVVALFFDVTDEDLDRRRRAGRIARIRQIAFYLCRTHTTQSLSKIGRAFHRNHASILTACGGSARCVRPTPRLTMTSGSSKRGSPTCSRSATRLEIKLGTETWPKEKIGWSRPGRRVGNCRAPGASVNFRRRR